MTEPLVISEKIPIPAAEISWTAVRASGPGGQNVNKVSSKIELRFDLEGTRALPEGAKARLRAIARSRIDAEGRVVVLSQLTRDRQRNLEDARAKLALLIEKALVAPATRKPTRTPRRAVRNRLDEKRRNAERKLGRAIPRD
jgi:ribosome-associated protein